MTKEQKDNAIELLFEIYDAGVQNKTVDLTGYLNGLNKALSLHNVVGQSEQLVDFQNFLILDGQLDIEADEAKRNAEIFLKDN